MPVKDMAGLGDHQRGTPTNAIAVAPLSSSPPLALSLWLRKFPTLRLIAEWNGVSSKPLSMASKVNSGWKAKHTAVFNKEHPPNKKYGPQVERFKNSGVENATTQFTTVSALA